MCISSLHDPLHDPLRRSCTLNVRPTIDSQKEAQKGATCTTPKGGSCTYFEGFYRVISAKCTGCTSARVFSTRSENM